MDKTRGESFELFCQGLDKVDYSKLDIDLCLVISEAINLLYQYHIADDILGQVILDDTPAEIYDGKKITLSLLDHFEKVMQHLAALIQKNIDNNKSNI